MASVETLFVTRIWRAEIALPKGVHEDIETACFSLAEDDEAGVEWCDSNGYPGYTSYSSLNDLPWRFPAFKTLQKKIEAEAALFAGELDFDLGGRKLAVDSLWVNILPPGGIHTSHIHPHSVLSGTYYVTVPQGAASIKYEDPRLGFMMMAPPRRKDGKPDQRPFAFIKPAPGSLLLWESWLRHEVPMNNAESERVSVSFNLSLR